MHPRGCSGHRPSAERRIAPGPTHDPHFGWTGDRQRRPTPPSARSNIAVTAIAIAKAVRDARIATRLGTVSFLNTTTIFGTPTDVTLSELAMEVLFPADAATIAIVRTMEEEEMSRQSSEAALQKAG
jgi:hypothetical protein